MSPSSNRRSFIRNSAAFLASAATLPLAKAIEPFKRQHPHIKGLSLAAYSFRSHLDWFKGKPTKGKMDLSQFLDYCAEQNLLGSELTAYFFPEPLTSNFINQLKRRAHILGLDITGGAIGNNFSFFPGSSEAEAQKDYVNSWVDHYADLGAPVIRVFAGARGPEGASEKQILQNIKDNLYQALEHAEKRGVILAMENHDSMQDVDRLIELARSVKSDYFGITWDSGNINHTADPYADLARLAPYAVNAQIKAMIPINGEKRPADFNRLVEILRKAAYSGYLVFEYEESPDPFDVVPEYLHKLSDALKRSL